jgi:predicted amidohydrolase
MRIAVAQITSEPADVEANVAQHAELIAEAQRQGARVVVFPELSLTGYELDAVARDPSLAVTREDARLRPLAAACDGAVAVVGAPVAEDGRRVLGAVVVDADGVRDVYAKQYLPDDEARVFAPGDRDAFLDLDCTRLALSVCFDSKHAEHAARCRGAGADAYLVGAMFVVGEERMVAERMAGRARDFGLWIALAQHAGASTYGEACGGSGVWSPDGESVVRLGTESPALAFAEIAAAATAAAAQATTR